MHRRLRARWFSLVPVRRRTMIAVAAVIGSVALLLAAGHYASVAWPSIAYRPEIARPLRLDRSDSFGRWITVALYAGCAGVSFLTYQLRRYRNDDFKGHYRLWRLVLVIMLLASVNALVSIIDWSGALMDIALGKRVALTGSDWIRLVVSIGGAVLALRLIAEVRHCKPALGMMLLASALLALPEAAKWNVLQVDSVGRWALVTAAPLLAATALFMSMVTYLRMLYREVRQIEQNDSLRDRFQQMRQRVLGRGEHREEEFERPEKAKTSRRRAEALPSGDAEQPTDDDQQRPKRRWLGLRREKPPVDDADVEPEGSEEPTEKADQPDSPRKKRRRFSMRLSPPAGPAGDEEEVTTEAEAETDAGGEETVRGRGWFGRKKKRSSEEDVPQDQAVAEEEAVSEPEQTPAEVINPDEIDWSSLSKSEKRRLRKQLKRQNRAA